MKHFFTIILFATISMSCDTFSKKPTDNDPQEKHNIELVGGDRDKHGCIGSAGYTWSEVRKRCIRPWREGVRMTSVKDSTLAAYAVFSLNSTKAEIFMSDDPQNQVLHKTKSETGVDVWRSHGRDATMLELINSNNRWQLIHHGKVMYQ